MDSESIHRRIADLLRRRHRFVVATIVDTKGSCPQTSGKKMLIHQDGTFEFTIGGGTFEAEVIQDGLSVFTKGSISSPGMPAVRIRNQVRLADVAPTIAGLAGLSFSVSSGGQNVASLVNGQTRDLPAYSESYYTNLLMGWAPLHSLRWSNKKWVDAPKQEFYNLSNDPKELKNIYTSSSVPAGARQELMKHVLAEPAVPPENEVDPETREKLASLGYITGATSVPASSTFDPKDGIKTWNEIETAVQLAQMGRKKESEQRFIVALQQQPDNMIAQKFLAKLYLKDGEPRKALPYLQKALKSNLHDADTRYDIGEAYYELKQYNDALQILDPVLKNKPDSRTLKFAAGCALAANDYTKSAEYLQNLLEKTPSDSDSLSLYARVLSQLGEDTKAIQAYTQLSSLRTLREEEAVQAAAIFLTSNQAAQAEKYFEIAIQSNPESVPAWRGIALIRLSRGEIPEAIEAFLRAGDCDGARSLLEKVPTLPEKLLESYKNQCP